MPLWRSCDAAFGNKPVEEGMDDSRENGGIYHGEIAPRRLPVAVALNLLMPGLGQIYCGALGAGLGLYFGVMIAAILFGAVIWNTETFLLRAMMIAFIGWSGLQIVLLTKLRPIVRRDGPRYLLRPWNHPITYIALFLGLVLLPSYVGWTAVDRYLLSSFVISDRNAFPALLPGDSVYGRRAGPPRGSITSDETATRKLARHRLRGRLAVVEGLLPRPTVLRVVGVPGDTIYLDHGRVVVNDAPLYRRPLGRVALHEHTRSPSPAEVANLNAYYEISEGVGYEIYIPEGLEPEQTRPITLGADEFFVLADNRGVHEVRDSRRDGPVSGAQLTGDPLYIWWSEEPATGKPRWWRIGLAVE